MLGNHDIAPAGLKVARLYYQDFMTITFMLKNVVGTQTMLVSLRQVWHELKKC